MAEYHYYFFAADGHITARNDYEAEADELAIIEARARYAESIFKDGFEVWQGKRMVYSEGRLPRRS